MRLETRKITALLTYLSLSEHPQSREKLAALFWPEFDQSRAPANLRRGLASLRASIPGDWLDAERDRISMRANTNLWVDVRVARTLVSDMKAHPHDPWQPCPECLDLVVKAIPLFQGEFLEGFTLPDCPEFDDWQVAERESLRAELGWLLERSARGHAAAERWEEALVSTKRWLAQDRMHEQAQALMVKILALSGQRSAAIRQYEEFAAALQEEFGQEPERETRELYNRIVSRRIGPRGHDEGRAACWVGHGARRSERAPHIAAVRSGRGASPGLLRPAFRSARSRGTGEETQAHPPPRAGTCARAWWSFRPAVRARRPSFPSWWRRPGCPSPGSHSMRATTISQTLRFLIDHRPSCLAILIATRADPPFPLARLCSQDRVAEIRAEDLRFTAAEAGLFFDRAMSLSLSASQVAVLEKRTEGWIAGLQMAALSLQGREDVDGFIASFSGTHRFILDYLAEEVLSRQDDELKRFLLDTSILTRMSAGLCEAVTGRGACQETLKRLERMNLFLVPLDEQRTWYRYHHLFADLLRHKLEHECPAEKVHELHLRTGEWCPARGSVSRRSRNTCWQEPMRKPRTSSRRGFSISSARAR